MRIKNMVMLEHFYKGVRHAELRLPCCDEPHPEPELPGGASQVCNLIKHYFSTTYRVLVYGVLPVFCFKCVMFRTLVKLYRGLQTPDYVQMCQCLIFLDQPLAVADVLGKFGTTWIATYCGAIYF